MTNKETAEFRGVCVDVRTELGNNSEPNILRANRQMMMVAICIKGCPDQAVLGAGYKVVLNCSINRKYALNDLLAACELFVIGRFENVLDAAGFVLTPWPSWVVNNRYGDGHDEVGVGFVN